ncbi:hypothetical protein M758_UG041700 [Ceratodon purpureus]|nr:hypothetical protein M758_UG041700 [Ceratodon purpureus]
MGMAFDPRVFASRSVLCEVDGNRHEGTPECPQPGTSTCGVTRVLTQCPSIMGVDAMRAENDRGRTFPPTPFVGRSIAQLESDLYFESR